MINLINISVEHKKYGIGKVIAQTQNYITVAFLDKELKFQIPQAFESFLTCCDDNIQKELLVLLEKKKVQEVQERSRQTYSLQQAAKHKKKAEVKENIAFKCNFCDGGKKENGIGYLCACSDEIIRYNIEEASHSWCCDEDAPCKQYYDGMIDRVSLDSYTKENEFVCYESQMLKNWTAFAGYVLKAENKRKPMTLKNVQQNSLAILTTRMPYAMEQDRFVFGVFLVNEAYEGDQREEGYVSTTSKYKLGLTLEEARKIRFWNYYHNSNAPQKTVWSQGLHRYMTDFQAANILRDIVKLKANTAEYTLAKEFLEYFCRTHSIDIETMPDADGALQR